MPEPNGHRVGKGMAVPPRSQPSLWKLGQEHGLHTGIFLSPVEEHDCEYGCGTDGYGQQEGDA